MWVLAVCALVLAAPAQASWRRYRVADAATTLRRVNALRAYFGARPLKLVQLGGATLRRSFTTTAQRRCSHSSMFPSRRSPSRT